ncbi:hypothetical protein [Pseudomonas guariconensis]|uniref:hypothetical protein n=1 Tax=Pseudomonas guariconensis TaxID=1288410 RepID=UPI001E36A619|nr:hypothetical protein [Pseudomonas guariconensis]
MNESKMRKTLFGGLLAFGLAVLSMPAALAADEHDAHQKRSAGEMEKMDHGQMDHGSMDHGKMPMDHGKMMDHGSMKPEPKTDKAQTGKDNDQ